MIWTDGIFVSLNDLKRVDSEVSDIQDVEGIVVEGNYGSLRGGLEEASLEMNKMMVAYGGYLSSGDISPNHISAVLNIGLGNAVRYKALLSQIVVTGANQYAWNHVKTWAAHFCLMSIYRNATNRTTKDRYEGKMRYYKSELDRRITKGVTGLGLPLIIQPMAAPAALFERNSGAWSSSNVTAIASGTTSGGTYDVAITYVNQGDLLPGGGFRPDSTKYVSSSQVGNAESNPSTLQTIQVPANSVVSVNISSLIPPTGTQDPATRILCVIAPLAATGWNVWVGPTGETLTLQNASPIPISTKTYQLASDPTADGALVGFGQYADRILSMSPVRQRG